MTDTQNIGTKRTSPIPRPVVRALGQMGEDLHTWRLLLHLTVQQVADRAGVNPKTVRSIETGKGATLENVLRVARALGRLESAAGVFDPYRTDVGVLRAGEELPRRVRHNRRRP